MTETKYGVISDVHEDPRVVPFAIDVLKRKGVNSLLVNGDIGGHYGDLSKSRNYTAMILDSIGKSDLESFVQPGSHETISAYGPVVEHFVDKYPNIINAIKNRRVEKEGHDLVFLPGSDWCAGGEFKIENEDIETGSYQMSDGRPIFITSMNDLKDYVNDPDKTILVCHIPRKFDDIGLCVDMAYFAETQEGGVVPGIVIENQIREKFGNVSEDEIRLIAAKNGLKLQRANRGNEELKNIYEELGIKKGVTGHFHESVHRANDSESQHVEEGKRVNELFWNASYLDGLKAGILTVYDDASVSYENVNMRE